MARVLTISCLMAWLLMAWHLMAGVASAAEKPNILFILTDDQGWPTLGCYGSKHVATPHLDQLAKEGVRFTAAYVTPQCTPTRAALLTGQHPARTGFWHVIPKYGYPFAPVAEPAFAENLSREAFTLAKGLQSAGYTTACMGKWHLTANADGNYVQLMPDAAKHYGFDVVATPGPGSQNAGDKHVNHLTSEAIAFIDKNKDKPWFCYLSHHTLHGVVSAPPELVQKHLKQGAPAEGLYNATYLAAIEHLDASVGTLLKALDERKLRDNTMVVFLSDNGGVSRAYDVAPFRTGDGKEQPLKVRLKEFENTPLRNSKGTLYEGGIRVPCIVRWPDHAKSGIVCDTPIQVTDWLPTLFEIASAKVPTKYAVDGTSLSPLLAGRAIAERSLYWYAPLYDLIWGATPAAVVRTGDYKLIEFFGDSFTDEGTYRSGHRLELYNLKSDPGEKADIAARHPTIVRDMRDDLHRFLKSVNATIAGPNPKHDPTRPFQLSQKGSK